MASSLGICCLLHDYGAVPFSLFYLSFQDATPGNADEGSNFDGLSVMDGSLGFVSAKSRMRAHKGDARNSKQMGDAVPALQAGGFWANGVDVLMAFIKSSPGAFTQC
jgi:hypothetical protein